MTRKAKRDDTLHISDPGNQLQFDGRKNEPPAATLARIRLWPSVLASRTLREWGKSQVAGEFDCQAVVAELEKQALAASANDLTRVESMLTIQAHTLDSIFNALAQRSALNLGEYPEAMERYMRLALRAQAQCRATIESLAEIKNPKPVAFVHQANIAGGHQQVNNGLARGGELNPTSKVLESDVGKRLEQSSKGETICGDISLAAVGTGDGTEVPRGKGARGAEQPEKRRVRP